MRADHNITKHYRMPAKLLSSKDNCSVKKPPPPPPTFTPPKLLASLISEKLAVGGLGVHLGLLSSALTRVGWETCSATTANTFKKPLCWFKNHKGCFYLSFWFISQSKQNSVWEETCLATLQTGLHCSFFKKSKLLSLDLTPGFLVPAISFGSL